MITSAACRLSSTAPSWIASAKPRMEVSGVRRSCDTARRRWRSRARLSSRLWAMCVDGAGQRRELGVVAARGPGPGHPGRPRRCGRSRPIGLDQGPGHAAAHLPGHRAGDQQGRAAGEDEVPPARPQVSHVAGEQDGQGAVESVTCRGARGRSVGDKSTGAAA